MSETDKGLCFTASVVLSALPSRFPLIRDVINMNRLFRILTLLAFATAAQLDAQDWLPKDAKICFRSQQEEDFLPDATFRLKANVTREQFDTMVKTIWATPHTPTRQYSDDKIWLS